MNNEQIISEVLLKCQKYGKTVIVGGYIRNKLLGYDFKDVDLQTTCSPQRLKTLFPQLTWTEQGLGLGVTRMNFKGISFEFCSCFEEDYEHKLKDRDFTVNAFYFDGEQLMSQETGLEDIQNKILRPMPHIEKHMEFSSQTFIRAFRLASLYNLKWSNELIELFSSNKHIFKEIPSGRLQSEAYETLKGENVLRSFFYYQQVGLILKNETLVELQDVKIPLYNQNLSARIIYLSYLIGKQTVIDWLNLHFLSNRLIEDIQEYLPYLKTDKLKITPKKLPFLTLLKRYQFKDDKEKIKEFLKQQR